MDLFRKFPVQNLEELGLDVGFDVFKEFISFARVDRGEMLDDLVDKALVVILSKVLCDLKGQQSMEL